MSALWALGIQFQTDAGSTTIFNCMATVRLLWLGAKWDSATAEPSSDEETSSKETSMNYFEDQLFRAVMREEAFTYIDDENGGKQTTFAVSRLRRYCEAHNIEKVKIPVEQHHADRFWTTRGVEQHRLDRLRLEDLTKPLLFILWKDHDIIMLDGTHRYVRLFQLGVPECIAWVVEDRAVWERFIIDVPQMPENIVMGFSGIF